MLIVVYYTVYSVQYPFYKLLSKVAAIRTEPGVDVEAAWLLML